MSNHAQLSPSGRHRWGACPGSVREEAPYQEPPANKAATDGTHSHALLERCIKFPGFILENSAGEVMKSEDGEFTIDAERIERVAFALAYIKERAAAAGTTPISETRVHPDGLTGRADLHGTVDVQIPGKEVYEIIDYKDGMAFVDAEGNPQLLQYAIGVLSQMDQDKLPKSVQLTILQPKMRLKGMSGVSTWNVPIRQIYEVEIPRLIAEAAATEDPNAPLVPGETQCKYCKAKGSCKALAQDALSKVGMMFQAANAQAAPPPFAAVTPTVVQPIDLAHQAANKDPALMDAAELRQILDAAPLLEQLLKSVKDEVKARLTKGLTVPGYKLVQGNGSRKWKLPDDELEKKITSVLKIPKKDLYKQVLPSPAQLEKITWPTKDGGTQMLTAEQVKKIQNEWVTYTPGGPMVAPEGDPRPALVNDFSGMFQQAITVEATPVTSPPPPPFKVVPPPFIPV